MRYAQICQNVSVYIMRSLCLRSSDVNIGGCSIDPDPTTTTLPLSKGNIPALGLAMVTNERALWSKKNTLYNSIQYNTPHVQITPEIYVF